MAQAYLIVQLGTPDSPAVADVRLYLKEFLMDPRVLTMPGWVRWLLVRLILWRRGPRSAEAYGKIWDAEQGSPLRYHSQKLHEALKERCSQPVYLAMRYGQPSLDHILKQMQEDGIETVKVLPLYPQYALSTTATVLAAIAEHLKTMGWNPGVEVIPSFFNHPPYIKRIAEMIRPQLQNQSHLMLSFHGIPESHITKTDSRSSCTLGECCNALPTHPHCYRAHCLAMSNQIAKELDLPKDRWTMTFQSRLGRGRWLLPATDATLESLAQSGIDDVVVVTPSFVADCLETIEEIGMEGRHSFMEAGGQRFELVPCPNSDPEFVEVMQLLLETKPGYPLEEVPVF